MLAILSAPGSRGDVNPMLAIGTQLRKHGYKVVISLAEPYMPLATTAGLIAERLVSNEEFDQLLSVPSVWKPVRGARAILKHLAGDILQRHLEIIERYHANRSTILVSHPLDVASRIFREANSGTPLVDVHLAPAILRTYEAPPRMSPWFWEPRRPAWLLRFGYRVLDHTIIDPAISSPINSARRKLGLTSIRRVLDQWWLSPDKILAMYPAWFAPATKQFQPRLVHCGFPLDKFPKRDSASVAQKNGAIVFTAGTGHRHCRVFFEKAAAACESLSQQGLLLSSTNESFPDSLPDCVETGGYIPFANLLPQAKLLVHHGGIGTTAACLASATPQLILPNAFDQFDNASRIERLSVGKWLRRENELTLEISAILDNASFQANAAKVAKRVSCDAVDVAVKEICETALEFGVTR
ncbi:MAG: nucleotide disphospho-sugar-binding domain-containing protein [Planctomycetota bacterium]